MNIPEAAEILHVGVTPDGKLGCRSCPNKRYPWPASYVASAKRINDLPPLDWPVCEAHMQHAMIAGWFPIRTVEEWFAAQTPPGDPNV